MNTAGGKRKKVVKDGGRAGATASAGGLGAGKASGKGAGKASGKAAGSAAAKGPEKGLGGERTWGTARQCLEWLELDGCRTSTKNFYAHYGPSSKTPVKRNADGLFCYPELLERVRMNRGEVLPADYDAVSKMSHARQRAELRIQEIKAEREDLALEEEKGNLVRKASVALAVNKLAQEVEDRRVAMCANLPGQLYGRTEPEIHRLLERATLNMFAGIAAAVRAWA